MNAVYRTVIMLLLCCSAFNVTGTTREPTTLPQAEASLKALFTRITNKNTDADNLRIADSLISLFNQTLRLPGSFDYPFDSLKSMGKITSADQKVRIFTWNLPLKDATNVFFGFLQQDAGNKKDIRVYRLNDKSATIENPAGSMLTTDNWYGCLVYDIIENKAGDITCYTLLGYAPAGLFISRKLTDVLWFDEQGEPVFGKPIFHYKNQLLCRILFEYSAKVQMSLKWNDAMKMIVFDHLSPIKSSYTGNYQFYGPDLSYDALRFEKGVWESVEDIDVRNSKE